MKKFFALLLALCLIVTLCACELKLPFGKKPETPTPTKEPVETEAPLETEAPDPNLGKYNLVACGVDDVLVDPAGILDAEADEGDICIELKKNGKVMLTSADEKLAGKYEIEGRKIFITTDEEDVSGTIGDGMIRLEDGDVMLLFAREDADISDLEILSMEEYFALIGGQNTGGTYAWGETDSYCLELVGVEPFWDYYDEPAIRIYYDFTNYSEDSSYASNYFSISACQDNCNLEWTFAEEDHALSGNEYMNLRPGVTVRCIAEFNYVPDGGEIRLIMKDWAENRNVIDVDLDPNNLPAAPTELWSPEPIWDPWWTDDLAWEGELDNFYVLVNSASYVTEEAEGDCIRIFVELTNQGEEEDYPYNLSYAVYQDGIELDSTWIYDDDETADDMYEAVAPGKWVMVSTVRKLRSDSPIEVEISDYWGEYAVGGVFEP